MNIWVATKNAHKVEEIQQILGDLYVVKSLLDIPDFPDIEENGATYGENALIKAKSLWEKVKEPVFADDSGLEVDALNGAPGLYSSRYSGPDATHEKNIDKLLSELKNVPDGERGARFRCVIAYIDENGNNHEFEGIFPGKIGYERSGAGGFGYDPVFYLPDRNCSVAEIPAGEKNRISHRGLAVEKFKNYLLDAKK